MRRRATTRVVAVCAAALALPALAFAQAFGAAHWKSKIEMEGVPSREGRESRGGRMPSEYEVWMKGGDMRMKADADGMAIDMLKKGDAMYTWMAGTGQGMKFPAGASARGGRSGQDYVNRIDEIRAKGKKVGAEKIDSHPCEIWEYQNETGEKGKYWLAQDLKGFPIQAVIEPARGGKVTYHNSDIQIGGSVPDDLFVLPKDVDFHDMSEMQGQPPRN